MKNAKLGVCVVGCGAMGTVHGECWRQVPEAQIVAVVDIEQDRAEKMARAHNLGTWYADYRAAVILDEVDVVSVCIPTSFHSDAAVLAASYGKHVISEKPIALTLRDADAMIDAARQNGVKLGVGFMRRHSPVLPELRKWLAEGQLGRPVMYHASDVRQIRPKLEMHDAHMNGGPVIDMGVHLFDLWTYIFDSEPVAVFAQGIKLAEHRPEIAHIQEIAYDTATILVRYASGDIGTFVVSWGLPPGVTPSPVPDQILGPEGAAQAMYAGSSQQVQVMREGRGWETLFTSDQNMYQLEIARFARCILEDRPFPATGEDGKAALRVALAALDSIKTGQPVFLS